MADVFDGLVIRITDLCNRRERTQRSIADDNTHIAELTANLDAAKARRSRHVERLQSLNRKIKTASSRISLADDEDVSHVDAASGIATEDETTQAAEDTLLDPSTNGQARDGDAIHKIFPTVVRVNGEWCELRCRTCTINFSKATGQVFANATAFWKHSIVAHKTSLRKTSSIEEYCTLRSISEGDADLLRSGQQAKDHQIVLGVFKQALGAPHWSEQTLGDIETPSLQMGQHSPYQQVHAKFPTVIKLGNRWVELTCLGCGCNAFAHADRFLSGPQGLNHHYRKSHQTGSQVNDLTTYCALRNLSDRDAELLQSGAQARDHPIMFARPTPSGVSVQATQLGAVATLAGSRPIHARFPTVVLFKDVWVEIACRYCYTNWSTAYSRFILGANGLRHHVGRLHKISVQLEDIEQYCTLRNVSERDRDLLLQGKNGVDQPVIPVYPRGDHTGDLSVYEPRPPQASPSAQAGRIHASFPTVVQLNGTWVEFSCKFCDANYSRQRNRYMSGVPGILHHVRLAHATELTSPEDVNQFCNVRPVSARDEELLRDGHNALDHPIQKVSASLNSSTTAGAKRKQAAQVRTPTDSDSESDSIRVTGRSVKRRAAVEIVPANEADEVEIKREEDGYDSNSSDDE
nr:hypothetical protein B0A51_04236 [Rachicladosporium sp. CCFEE 5018]